MLTGNCEQIIGMLGNSDFNVRVTVTTKPKEGTPHVLVDRTWEEIFKTCLGQGILSDDNGIYHVRLLTSKGSLMVKTTGFLLLEQCWPYLKDSDIVRIDIKKGDNPVRRSWIIMRQRTEKSSIIEVGSVVLLSRSDGSRSKGVVISKSTKDATVCFLVGNTYQGKPAPASMKNEIATKTVAISSLQLI